MLANSTERTVTVSGSSECVTQCIFQICAIMVEVSEGIGMLDKPQYHTTYLIYAQSLRTGNELYQLTGTDKNIAYKKIP